MNIELFDEVFSKHEYTIKSYGVLETLMKLAYGVSENAKRQLSFLCDLICFFDIVSEKDMLLLRTDHYAFKVYSNGLVDYCVHGCDSAVFYFKNDFCAATIAGEVVAIFPKFICEDEFWENLHKAEVSKDYDYRWE